LISELAQTSGGLEVTELRPDEAQPAEGQLVATRCNICYGIASVVDQ
jgi:hypothetical protein